MVMRILWLRMMIPTLPAYWYFHWKKLVLQHEPAKDAPPALWDGCLIATAAFGSELAPQVRFLRNFRDQHIMSTSASPSFMSIFNTWHYSFSPRIADYEQEQPWLQYDERDTPLLSTSLSHFVPNLPPCIGFARPFSPYHY